MQEYLQASPWKRFAYRLARNPLILFSVAPLFLFLIKHRFSGPVALFQAVKPVTFFASLKCLTFRLWDERRQQLVGFRELKPATLPGGRRPPPTGSL